MNLFFQAFLIGVAITCFFVSLIQLIQTRRKINKLCSPLPPGPPRLPIIGNLFHFATSCPHIYLHELSHTYGPFMFLKLGSIPTLVISSAKVAKQVMKTNDIFLSSRPKLAALQTLSYNGSDIGFSSYGEQWRQLKKLTIVHLFSPKKVKSFSSVREEEVSQMVRRISRLSDESKIVDLSKNMILLTSTVVCKIAFGRSDYALCGRSFIDVLKDTQQMLASFYFSDYFPLMGWVDKLIGTSSRHHKIFMELDRFYEEIIDEHMKSPKEGGRGDIVDVLLDLQRDSALGISITMNHIKGVLMDIFVAGTDTSSSTIIWAMTELIKNPKSMKQAQQEVRTLIGRDFESIIKEDELEKLIYLKAVVKETLRLHPVVPLLVPREAIEKCNVQGYDIKEKTRVYVNAWAIGRDPEAWENAEEFSPERFLGNNREIEFKGQDFELIPFGFGRRICPGIQMGVAMVELALANLICMFDWEVPKGMEEQIMNSSVLPGITIHKKIPLRLVAKINVIVRVYEFVQKSNVYI